MFIFLIYKKTYAGVMYSSGFGVTLLALTMITTLVILAVTSNVVLSLGMVGALSIVRFRTAIKEPFPTVSADPILKNVPAGWRCTAISMKTLCCRSRFFLQLLIFQKVVILQIGKGCGHLF